MLFPTNANQVQAFAGALYGVQVGSVTMAQVTSDITSGGGLNAVLNRYYSASFGSMTTTAVATTFATNLGLTGEALTEGVAYTVARLNAVTADARGAEISDILNLFSTLTADATFGTAATAWTTKVGTAAAYTGTTNVAIGTVTADSGGVFTLTAGIDSKTFGEGADSFIATGATLNATDSLDGGAGVDTLTINDTTGASAASLPAATIKNVEVLNVTANAGVGKFQVDAIAAGTDKAAVQQVATVVVGGTYLANQTITVTVNGAPLTATVGSIASGNGRAEAITAIKSAISSVAGDSVSYGSTSSGSGTSESSAFTVTSNIAGTDFAISTAIAVSTAGTTAMATASAAQTATAGATTVTPNVTSTGASAVKQVLQLAISDNTGPAAFIGSYKVSINGTTYTGAAAAPGDATDTTPTSIALDLVRIINSAFGSTVASNSSGVITITAPTAGIALPIINVDYVTVTGSTMVVPLEAFSVLVANKAQNSAGTAQVNAVVYDASGFADSVTTSAQGDVNLKAAKTAVVTATTTDGAVTVDGGNIVTVVATKAVTVGGADITSANVTSGTTSAAVAIGATSGTTAVTPKLTTATVKGGSDVLVTDETGGASAGTLTTVTISETADTTVTLEGKALTTLNVGKQTVATNITVTNANTLDHVFTLNVADTGKNGSSSAQVEVTNDTAKEVNLTAGGTDNNVLIDGDGSLTKMTVAGAGKLTLAIDSTTAIANFDASAMTGALTLTGLEAVALSVKTGSGNDSLTVVATAKQAVDSGAGNDTVTIDAAVAKGSTINLGAGDDVLLKGSSGSVAVDDTLLITTIDGGDGIDTVAASLVTSGNGNQFVNFERLGLTNSTLDAALLTATTITGLELLVGGGTYTNVNSTQGLLARADTSGTTTLTMSDVTGAADSYTITFDGDNSAATTAPTSANFGAGTVVTAGVENINIVSGGSKAWNSITLGANGDAENIVISGAANINIAFASGFGSVTPPATGVVNIDGSAATGKLDINLANVVEAATGYTVKGGSGADTITVADTVTTIFGGAGADTFKVALAVGSDDFITLADLAVGDKIDFGTAGAFNATAVDVSAQTSLAGAIGAADGTDDEVSYFVYGGNTYIVLAGATTSAVTDDTVIKLLGTYDLTLSTLASNVLTIA